jgi:drug/metabolite transporter (DMT)-like permease
MFHLMSGNRFRILKMVLGTVMISFSGVWVNLCHVSPTVSAFYRVLFGGLILLVAVLISKEMKWLGCRHLLLGILCGLVFAFDLVFYHYAVLYIGPGLGTILPNFQVFVLAIVGVLFLHEKIRITAFVSIPVAFLGLFMVMGVDWQTLDRIYRLGVYCGLATAFFYSAYILLLRKLQGSHSGDSIYQTLMVVSLFTALFIGLEVLRTGGSFRIPDQQSFWCLVALGLLSQAIGWILISSALPHIRAALSGLILLLQPALAFVWDVLIFKRHTTPLNWIGVAVVLVAIYFGTLKSGRTIARHRPD